jgi:hypothetical protein
MRPRSLDGSRNLRQLPQRRVRQTADAALALSDSFHHLPVLLLKKLKPRSVRAFLDATSPSVPPLLQLGVQRQRKDRLTVIDVLRKRRERVLRLNEETEARLRQFATD